jgi:hypothetical protein
MKVKKNPLPCNLNFLFSRSSASTAMTTSSVVLPALPFQNQVNINTLKELQGHKTALDLSPHMIKKDKT